MYVAGTSLPFHNTTMHTLQRQPSNSGNTTTANTNTSAAADCNASGPLDTSLLRMDSAQFNELCGLSRLPSLRFMDDLTSPDCAAALAAAHQQQLVQQQQQQQQQHFGLHTIADVALAASSPSMATAAPPAVDVDVDVDVDMADVSFADSPSSSFTWSSGSADMEQPQRTQQVPVPAAVRFDREALEASQLEQFRRQQQQQHLMEQTKQAALQAALSPALSPNPTGPWQVSLGMQPAQQAQQQRPGENVSRQMPTRWPTELLDLPCRELNRYLKKANLSPEDVKDLKAARRRKKNRAYAQSSRKRRLAKYDQLAVAQAFVGEQAQRVTSELQRTREANAKLVQREQQLVALISSVNPALLESANL